LELPGGVLVHVDLLGVIKMQQRKAGADVTRNDRLLGVPVLDHQDRAPRRMEDIPAAELDAIGQFFKAYQAADGVAVDVVGMGGAGDVEAIIAAAT
jgi:inorganic pyrophosphatase